MSASSESLQSHLDQSPHRPLADADEIRILGLEPGTPSDPIRCQLHHVKLSGNPIYEALSYMWGPKVFKIITLDGREYPVRENLWRALTHLRYKDSNLMLWIDAICIDQKDERERNHQVMQMGQIYNRASRVLAWLGLGEPSTNIAMEVLKRVVQAPKHFVPKAHRNIRSYFNKNRKGMRVVERIKMDLEKTEMDALEELCSREYWQRLWIVQEIHLAKDVLICCGHSQLEWKIFSQGLKAIVRDQTAFPMNSSDGSRRDNWKDNPSYTLTSHP